MASKRAMKRRMCGDKRAYPDVVSARRARDYAIGRWGDYQIHCYSCPVCRQWHVGHMPRELMLLRGLFKH